MSNLYPILLLVVAGMNFILGVVGSGNTITSALGWLVVMLLCLQELFPSSEEGEK